MHQARALELDIGAVLAPSVRSEELLAQFRAQGQRPVELDDEYLARFPPAIAVAFGRTLRGPSRLSGAIDELRSRLQRCGQADVLLAGDLEQGPGLHFQDAVRTPPALALAAAADARAACEAAGWLTGQGARERGVQLVLAPVADMCTKAQSPIIGVRSFGDAPARAGELAAAFLRGLHLAGVAGCAKHFPGHGDASGDSHLELPRIDHECARWESHEWKPFTAAIQAGVEAVMVAHLDVPALTGQAGLASSLSSAVVHAQLRTRLGFSGAVLSDAMDMGALAGAHSANARALAAGVDVLLCPADPARAAQELLDDLKAGRLERSHLARAAGRARELCARARARLSAESSKPPGSPHSGPSTWASELAQQTLLCNVKRWPWKLTRPCEVLHPLVHPKGEEARAALEQLRMALSRAGYGGGQPAGVVLPVVGEIGAWYGNPGPDAAALRAIEAKLESLATLGWPAALLWLATPKLIPKAWWDTGRPAILCGFAATPGQVAAAQAFFQGQVAARGCLPVQLG